MATAAGGPAPHRCAVTWLDVFTSRPLAGNALAVVHDADGVDDTAMLAFARETRLSETTFVQAAQDPAAADYRNRIWCMSGELPFAGHPTLGTAVAEARRRGGERDVSLVQQTASGLQAIELELGTGAVHRGSMLQAPAEAGRLVDPVLALGAAGLKAADADPDLPCQVVSTGLPHLLAPVGSREALDRLAPSLRTVEALLAETHATCLYLAHVDAEAGVAHARSIFLDPGTLSEDPATGSAAGPLCAHVAAHGGSGELVVHQGEAMGRPSRIACALEADGIRVGGECVVVMEAHARF